jgi:hypothetical protein
MSCVFCGATGPLTKEHVFPVWLRDLFPDVTEVDNVRHYAELDGSKASTDEWGGGAFTSTVRDVCASCNNGWMSNLEREAQVVLTPLIGDKATNLDPTAMATAATWATKTALVSGLAVPGEREMIAPEMYRWFGEYRQPLPGGIVWLGRYEGDGQWPISLHQHGGSFTTEDSDEEYGLFHVVFAIGHLVLAVFGHELPGDPPLSGAASRTRLLIWPSTKPIRWPPPLSMTQERMTAESAELPDQPD